MPTDKALIDYLALDEVRALLDMPDPRTLGGIRDRTMLHLTYPAGLRASERPSLRLTNFPDRSLATVHLVGKGRRERVLPLWRETQAVLRAWPTIKPDVPAPEIFLNRDGKPMTRDGLAHRLARDVTKAAVRRPSILGKHDTHLLLHS